MDSEYNSGKSLRSSIRLDRSSLAVYLPAFGITYFIIVTGFFFTRNIPIAFLQLQDLLVTINPFILILFFWRIALIEADFTHMRSAFSLLEQFIFLLGTISFCLGSGMNQAANAINRFRGEFKDGSALKDSVEFYDEILGHILFFIGSLILHTLWLLRDCTYAIDENYKLSKCQIFGIVMGGLFHSWNLFAGFIEGQFAIPGLIWLVFMAIFLILKFKNHLTRSPIAVFNAVFVFTTIILMVIWFVMQDGSFPEFSEVGFV